MLSKKVVVRLLILISAFIMIIPVSAQNNDDAETEIIERVTLALNNLEDAESYRYQIIDSTDLTLSTEAFGQALHINQAENTSISGSIIRENEEIRVAVRGLYESYANSADLDEEANTGLIDFEMVRLDADTYLLVTASNGSIDVPRFVPDGWFLLSQDFPLITELTIIPTLGMSDILPLADAISINQRDTIITEDGQSVIPYTFEFDGSILPIIEFDQILQGFSEDLFGDSADEFIDAFVNSLHIKLSILIHEESGELYAISQAISSNFFFEIEVDGFAVPVNIGLYDVESSWYTDFNDSITIIAPDISGN